IRALAPPHIPPLLLHDALPIFGTPFIPLPEQPRLCPAPIEPAACASHYQLAMGDSDDLEGEALRRVLDDKRRFVEFLFGRVYDRVIFPTELFRDFFLEAVPVPATSTRVIDLGTDTTGLRPSNPPPGCPRFLFIGQLHPIKGVEMLRDAFLQPSLLGREDYSVEIHGPGTKESLGELLDRNPR